MALSIPEIVRQFKTGVGKALSASIIGKICVGLGYFCRHRVLDPATTVHLFLLQIMEGNTACSALPHLAEMTFTASAYCAARKRLPVELFQDVLQHVCDGVYPEMQKASCWQGRRTWLLDGSSFSMPDTPALQKHFGQPSGQAPGCGFPTAHLLALFHAETGLLLRVLASPQRTHDLRHASKVHSEMDDGDVLVADRGLASYAHLALLSTRKIDAVLRCHQQQLVDFRAGRPHTGGRKPKRGVPRSRYVKWLGRGDQIVEYYRPAAKPVWMEEAEYAALPAAMLVREVRYQTPGRTRRTKVITLVTTLLDAKAFPKAELAKLYESRWQIETNFRHLKTTMGMEVLHCKTVDGVMKELYMFAIAYNLVRLVMLEAARRQQAAPDRISFKDALRWLRAAKPGTLLGRLIVNKPRPYRVEPRVLKRRMKEYALMNKPRAELRKQLSQQNVAA